MGGLDMSATDTPVVAFAPPSIVRQQTAAWGGIHVDSVELVRHEPFDYKVEAPGHLLIASERAERYDGETLVDGLPRSHLRAWSGKMTFVPAGCRFYGWQKPRALTRSTFLLIDPQGSLHPALRLAEIEFRPRLFFFDRDLWETALKLKAQVEHSCRAQRAYVEALSIALAHELVRMNDGIAPPSSDMRGGLSGLATKEGGAIHRRAPCRGRLAIVAGPVGAAQPVPFFPSIQAVVRHAAAPISDQPANRARQAPARGAQIVGDRN